jgi:hypothetical protein
MKRSEAPMNGQRKKAGAVGLVAAGAVAGGILASSIGANAATPATTAAGTTAATTAPPAATSPTNPGPGGANPVRSDESLATGTTLDTLKAAALKAVPGATIIRIESDSGDGVWEAHMTKSDGSLVTVKFDKSLTVTQVEQGMGK